MIAYDEAIRPYRRLALLAHQGDAATMTTALPSQSSTSRRRRLRWVLLAAAALTAAAAGTGVWYFTARRMPAPPDLVFEGTEPDLHRAVQRAREAVLKEPRSAKAWGALGDVFTANELEAEGAACYAQAERLDPKDPRWPYHQAGALLNQGQREEAVVFFRRAADRCKDSTPAPRLFLGETLLTLGQVEEAEGNFRQVLAHDKDDPRANYDMGLLCIARQDWPAARAHLLRCLSSPQTRQKARAQLSVVLLRLGEAAEADKYRQQAARLPKDSSWVDLYVGQYLSKAVKKRARFRKAEYLELAGKTGEAADEWVLLVREFPNDDAILTNFGKVTGQMGRYAESEQALRKARQIAPEKMLPHYYLALVLYTEAEQRLRQGGDRERARAQFREAVELTRQALALKPDYGVAHLTLGLCLKHLGQRDEAIAELRQAVQCNPEYAELHFRLGEILAAAVREPAEARARLEQAVQMAGPEVFWRQTAADLLAGLAATQGGNGKGEK
jgi:tetratricopeptide (TPR) repeat protein